MDGRQSEPIQVHHVETRPQKASWPTIIEDMTKKEFLELLGKSAMDLYNDPEKLRKVNAEFESMKMEHPEFFDRVDQLTIGDMTPDELKKMFDYIKDHILKNRMAN